MNTNPKAAVIMGSDSDFPVVKKCIVMLKKFGIEADVHIISAHRTPDSAAEYAKNAAANGVDVIIAAAGKAAHLAGVLAAFTTLPVIGVPIKGMLDGLDAMLSIIQMPPGIPVATVGVNGALNAAILAAEMLALSDEVLAAKLCAYKEGLKDKIVKANQELSEVKYRFKVD